MKGHPKFSFERLRGIIAKEFLQMRRDRLTFAMMLGIPLIQLTLFGFAINSDPRHLPAAVLLADQGPQGRTLLYAMKNSTYFDFVRQVKSESEGHDLLARGQVQFVINIPQNFSRDLLRGDRPSLLVEADATDPAATGIALGSLGPILDSALQNDLKGALGPLAATSGPIDLRVHALYNPEVVTQYNIVPGLMGVILTMTMVMITGLAITRERERGTMENLLSMPTRPSEVLIGKIVPYILVGYIQVSVILIAAHFLFHVPMQGSISLLLLVALVLRHAALGSNGRRGIPAHPFSAHRPRHSVERQRRHRCQPPALADRTLRTNRSDDRNKALPANVGLGIFIMSILLFAFCALAFRKKIG